MQLETKRFGRFVSGGWGLVVSGGLLVSWLFQKPGVEFWDGHLSTTLIYSLVCFLPVIALLRSCFVLGSLLRPTRGNLINSSNQEEILFSLALGLAVLAGVIFLAGYIPGAYNGLWWALLWGLCWIKPISGFNSNSELFSTPPGTNGWQKVSLVGALLAGMYFLLLMAIDGIRPIQGVDQLYYHLPVPWEWAKNGGHFDIPWIHFHVHTGDMHRLWVLLALWWPEKIAFHLMTQHFNLILGTCVAAYAFFIYWRQLTGSQALAMIGVALFMASPLSGGYRANSSNDFPIMIMTFLGARQLWIWQERRTFGYLISGLATLCFAFSSKNTGAFPIVVILGFVAILARKEWRILFRPAVLGMGLWFLHYPFATWLSTGNPFFPAFPHLFKSPVWNDLMEAYNHARNPVGIGALVDFLFSWIKYAPLIAIAPLGFLFLRKNKEYWFWALITLGTTVIAFLLLKDWVTYCHRYVFIIYVAWITCTLMVLSKWGWVKQGPGLVICLVIAMAGSRAEVRFREEIKDYRYLANNSWVADRGRNHIMIAQDWLNNNSHATGVLTFGRPERYYLNAPLFEASQSWELVMLYDPQRSLGEVLGALQRNRISHWYIHHTRLQSQDFQRKAVGFLKGWEAFRLVHDTGEVGIYEIDYSKIREKWSW